MPELSIENKKAKFETIDNQIDYLSRIKNTLTVNEMATICNCSTRCVRHWCAGEVMMPYKSLVAISEAAGVGIPKVTLIDRYEHTSWAGKKGGLAVIQKYGRVPMDETIRYKAWLKWWQEHGKFSQSLQKTKYVELPVTNVELAEFIGIMLGDGGMSAYQVSVTLHSADDYEYSLYVKDLMGKLFGVTPSVYYRQDAKALNIVLGRKQAVDYLHSLGLVRGNKVQQKVKIPDWILKNESYSLACLRGLMDTDGSVYLHQYKVDGKLYKYKKLCFSSASDALRKDVQFILHRFGSAATCSGTNVRIDSVHDVKRYMEIIGTHNPKHLKRYSK